MKELNYGPISDRAADKVCKLAKKMRLETDICGDWRGAIIAVIGTAAELKEFKQRLTR